MTNAYGRWNPSLLSSCAFSTSPGRSFRAYRSKTYRWHLMSSVYSTNYQRKTYDAS